MHIKRLAYLYLTSLGMMLVAGCSKGNLKKIIQDHFIALNRHDVKALVKNYDPKVQVISPAWEGIHNGTEEISKAYKGYFKASPDLKYDVGGVYFSGDSIITVEYTASGTMKNDEGSLPAYMTGKRYIINYCAIFTIKNDKIVKETSYYDQVSFLRQVGFFDQK